MKTNLSYDLIFAIELFAFSAAYLREHCRRNELYMIPKYNDVLYLHYKVLNLFQSIQQSPPRNSKQLLVQGLSEIENLEEYTDLKCLWLENNCIKTIKGLDHLSLLKCLFLHHNRIEHITVARMNFAYHLNSPLRSGSVQVERVGQLEPVQQLHQPADQPCSPAQPSHLQCVQVVNTNHEKMPEILKAC